MSDEYSVTEVNVVGSSSSTVLVQCRECVCAVSDHCHRSVNRDIRMTGTASKQAYNKEEEELSKAQMSVTEP